jgi:protein phosphatase
LDSDIFAVADRLHTLKLHRPAVLSPLAVFTDSSWDERRYYYVIQDIEARRSSEVDPPHPSDCVMAWGIALADGLAALHRSGLAFRSVIPEHILICDEEARWLCCEPLVLMEGASENEVNRALSSDVRGLGRWLLLQMTGKTSLSPDLSLPDDPLALLLRDVLTAPYPMSAQQLAEQLDQIRRQFVVWTDVRLWIGARSDTGRVRKLNEDSMWVADYRDAFSELGVAVGAFAVADGVGGHAAGDVASQLTVDVLQQYGDELRRTGEIGDLPETRAWMAKAAEAANERVHRERQAVSNDMGSTLVMALFIGNNFAVLNVGDSRAYRLGLQDIQQISIDHTLVERLVAIGQITRNEAKLHPRRNVIYRVIGGRPELEYDYFDQGLAVDEALLLCSDGLTDMLTDRVLWQIWQDAPSPQAACDRMVDEANQVGGHDNITVIIVQVTTTPNKDVEC